MGLLLTDPLVMNDRKSNKEINMNKNQVTVKELKLMLDNYDSDMKVDFYPLSFSFFEGSSENKVKVKYDEIVFREETGRLVELKAIPQHEMIRIAERLSVLNSQDNVTKK
jgi:translation initiation factor IF-3